MNVQLPAKYTAARNALAEAHSVDEVKDIRDKAVAMEVYAKQAKDGELVGYATEMRKRAERRLGELMAENAKAGKVAKGTKGQGRPKKIGGSKMDPPKSQPTLAEQGVDKHLADRARKAAAMAEKEFEAAVAETVANAVAAVEGDKSVIKQARKRRHETKRKKRDEREQTLAEKQVALPNKRYGVILADPEWKFEFWSELGKTNSSADNHYTTSDLAVIEQRKVEEIAADDCVLFLWATAPMMPQALAVMKAWGFEYKSQAVWDKEVAGTGYWFRNQHELLLVGVRGEIPAPADGMQWPSVIRERRTEHSAKPEKSYQLIEHYFPNLPKIELNQRKARAGWDGWGLEAPAEAAA